MFKSILKTFYRDFLSSDKKPRERNRLKGPALRSRSLKNPPEGFFGLCALKAQRLHTLGDIQNDPPMSASRSTGGSVVFELFLLHIITDACVSL